MDKIQGKIMSKGLSESEIRSIEEYFDLSEGKEQPLALWIIGRSAAGKTTIASLLKDVLRKAGRRVELIDGETVRSLLNNSLGYSANDRLAAFMKYVYISQLLQSRGIIPITATIGGFRKFREIVRTEVKNSRFIYLDCPFEVAAQRDQKGLYARALAGEVKNFFDVDVPYEVPDDCEIKIDSAKLKPSEIVSIIVEHFDKAGLLENENVIARNVSDEAISKD